MDADLEYESEQPVTMTKLEVIRFSEYVALRALGLPPAAAAIAVNAGLSEEGQQSAVDTLDAFVAAGNRVPEGGL